jgi:large subunit ribosomal protein L15
MTDKKRRQRGSRTHGGGSHKNRRGAGHRGGRGAAGRSKHEFHNYGPLGKHGFTRPEKVQETVLTIDVQKLDEDASLYAADGLAEEENGSYRLDARDVVEDGHEADAVKVLGGGQVRNELSITADAFSASAVELIEEAGGEAIVSERGQVEEDDGEDEDADGTDKSEPKSIEQSVDEA